jgi:F-type H+-transporting ATPase subunit delta
MSATRIAGRYAKSLIDLAQERGQLDAVYNDMTMFAEVAQNRDFALLLKSPIIPADKKESIIKAIFEGKISDLTSAFINILLTKNREMYLADVAKEVVSEYKNINKVSTVKLITATPLDAANLDTIKRRLVADNALHDNVDIQTAVDSDLIGGFVLEFDNKRYDASVASQLAALRKEFSTNLYIDQV